MAEPVMEVVENPLATPQVRPPWHYEQQDFRRLYEREFELHQQTQIKLQAALDRIVYLEQRIEKLEADNLYLRKLLFSKKTERGKVDVEPSLDEEVPKTHGAQKGHPGYGRKIPFHLPQQDRLYRIKAGDSYCRQCGAAFEELNQHAANRKACLHQGDHF